MENQHKLIKGYRDLSEAEIRAMNDVKRLAEQCGEEVELLMQMDGVDKRWVAIGKTQLQQGFMAIIRGIAQPTTF